MQKITNSAAFTAIYTFGCVDGANRYMSSHQCEKHMCKGIISYRETVCDHELNCTPGSSDATEVSVINPHKRKKTKALDIYRYGFHFSIAKYEIANHMTKFPGPFQKGTL